MTAPTQDPKNEMEVIAWPALARSYHAHHFNCPVCIAAGLGYGQRCQVGALLWTAYQEAVA